MKKIKNQRNSSERDELLFDLSPCSGSQLWQNDNLVKFDVYIWVWSSFVEIGTDIFVSFIYFIESILRRAFLSKSPFHKSLILELRPKRDFERLES
jgi:hypothetical protein